MLSFAGLLVKQSLLCCCVCSGSCAVRSQGSSCPHIPSPEEHSVCRGDQPYLGFVCLLGVLSQALAQSRPMLHPRSESSSPWLFLSISYEGLPNAENSLMQAKSSLPSLCCAMRSSERPTRTAVQHNTFLMTDDSVFLMSLT